MQEGRVRNVEGVLDGRVERALGAHDLRDRAVPGRVLVFELVRPRGGLLPLFVERRRVDPHEAVFLERREGRRALALLAAVALERRDGPALARAVEAPAVVRALDGAVARGLADRERHVPVGAAVEQRAGPTFAVAEEHELRPEELALDGLVPELARERDDEPMVRDPHDRRAPLAERNEALVRGEVVFGLRHAEEPRPCRARTTTSTLVSPGKCSRGARDALPYAPGAAPSAPPATRRPPSRSDACRPRRRSGSRSRGATHPTLASSRRAARRPSASCA